MVNRDNPQTGVFSFAPSLSKAKAKVSSVRFSLPCSVYDSESEYTVSLIYIRETLEVEEDDEEAVSI